MNDNVDPVITRHLDHLRVRNLRPSSIANRRYALYRLQRWAQRPIIALDENDLRVWQACRSSEIQAEPLRTEMSHHRQFYRWALREQLIRVDPTLRIELPRVARRLPRPIRDAMLAEAMAHADPEMAGILALAAFAGLRACEIAQLDWAEVGLGEQVPQLRVAEGKGGHTRLLPMSAALASVLDRMPYPRRGPVVKRLDLRPGPNKPHRISSRANEYLHSLGIPETLHQLRHRFGTSAYQACQDIRAVQELLGHASPTSTAIYAAAASAVVREAVEAAGSLHVKAS